MRRVINFGEQLHGPQTYLRSKLLEYPAPDGHSFLWKRIVQCADQEVLVSLLEALQQGSEFRNLLFLSAVCGGYDGMGRPIGKNGLLKRSARRFIFHAQETVELVCLVAGLKEEKMGLNDFRKHRHLVGNIQNGFLWLTPPNKKHAAGHLSASDASLAKAFVVADGSRRGDDKNAVVSFIADHYEELRPYFQLIYRSSKDIGVSGMQALLATKPVASLSSGAL